MVLYGMKKAHYTKAAMLFLFRITALRTWCTQLRVNSGEWP